MTVIVMFMVVMVMFVIVVVIMGMVVVMVSVTVVMSAIAFSSQVIMSFSLMQNFHLDQIEAKTCDGCNQHGL